MKDKNSAIASGIIFAQLFAIVVTLAAKYIWDMLGNETSDVAGVLVASEFILIPFSMGIVSAYFWKNITLRTPVRLLYALFHLIILCAWSWFFLGEGYICIIIVSPLIYVFLFVGIIVGYYMFRKNNNTVNFSILSLITVVYIADLLTPHKFENMVADTLVINAPITKVWPYVVAYEPIDAQPDYWLFNIGMPNPVQSTVSAYKKGANRKCIFSNGYVFDEVMTVFEPKKNLTFDITNQPRDPEIMGHIDILRGQFLLKDNGDGTTTLTGNSWYRLHVFPAWYYNIWAESITRNVHVRVMEHIKLLCEKDSK